jgi:excisionase family DNA binding protein
MAKDIVKEIRRATRRGNRQKGITTMEDGAKEIVDAINGLREDLDKPADGPMTREQAAAYLQVHKGTVYDWAKKGLLPYSKLGDGEKAPMRFSKEDLDYFAKDQRRVMSRSEAKAVRRDCA